MILKRLSLVGFVILVLAVLGLMAQGAILAGTPVMIAAQVAAVLLMLWSRLTFGLRSFHAGANPTEGGLVTTGPYRYLRHPIYAAILLFLSAAVLSHLSPATVAMALASAIGAALRIFAEERLLIERYPEYAVCATRTKRIIPFLL
jgi:protein-S-isoprenylcysteine O-methyltransferase Ste14